MKRFKSCGVLCFRQTGDGLAFLLMSHRHRLDLPKGHLEPGETEQGCALREFREETGLPPETLFLDETFRYEETYYPTYKRLGGETVEKTIVVFLGLLNTQAEVEVSEHQSHLWVPWQPPHTIQAQLIDPLLARVATHLQNSNLLNQSQPTE